MKYGQFYMKILISYTSIYSLSSPAYTIELYNIFHIQIRFIPPSAYCKFCRKIIFAIKITFLRQNISNGVLSTPFFQPLSYLCVSERFCLCVLIKFVRPSNRQLSILNPVTILLKTCEKCRTQVTFDKLGS